MRLRWWCFMGLLMAVPNGGTAAVEGADDPPATARLAEIQRRHGLDPGSSLESRIKDPGRAVFRIVDHFRRPAPNRLLVDPGSAPAGPLQGPEPTPHTLTDAERDQLHAAVAILPPRHRQILTERLHAFNFVDAMVVGGTVITLNDGEHDPLFDIAINASVFRQTASEWLTDKERSVFLASKLPLSVRIDVGPELDALAYVLLHEATHVVDQVEGITGLPDLDWILKRVRSIPQGWSDGLPNNPFIDADPFLRPPRDNFLDGVWDRLWDLEPRYVDPRRSRVEFYAPTGAIPADEMLAVYMSLATTPLASLYSGRNPLEDLAEFVTLYHLTEKMGRPYRIILGIEGIEILVFEPMSSPLIQSRFGAIRRFYQ